MKLHPRVSRTGVELVKRFEGLRRRAARLPDGGWTIGYGHTLSAREGAEVSPQDAEALLYYDLSAVAGKLDAWTFTPLNQNQFEALNAFAFNIGLENFRSSTVLKRVNEGQHLLAAAAMELWRKAAFNGEDLVVDALVRRRAAEKAHYLTPPEGFRPAPSPVLRPTFDHSVIEAAAQAQTARHAAVVDVPMEGDTAIAFVEPVVGADPSVAIFQAPRLCAQAQGGEAEPHAKAEISPAAEPPANDRPADQPSPIVAPAPFRGFEPPPRRLDPASVLDTPAKPAEVEALEVSTARDEQTSSSSNLLDQPVSPLAATTPLESVRSMRLSADADTSLVGPTARPEEATKGLRTRFAGTLSHKYRIIYGSLGALGLFLFCIAVGTMAFGNASSATVGALIMGVCGIALMVVAGVWFLALWNNGSGDNPKVDPQADRHA